MANKRGLFGILAIALIFGMAVVSCDSDSDSEDRNITPQTVRYSGVSGSTSYSLIITENTARYAVQAGDSYELIAGSKKSTGTVIAFSGGVLTLKPSNSDKTFTVTTSGSNLTGFTGSVKWDGDTTETTLPDRLTANSKTGGGGGGGSSGGYYPGGTPSGSTINIAMINATYPVLDFTLSIFDINDNPTYVCLERKNTYDYNKLPENVFLLPETTASSSFYNADTSVYADFVKTKYEYDKTTHFNLYICSRVMGLILTGMTENGIPEDQYTVNIYLDGALYGPELRYTSAVPDVQALYDSDCAKIEEAFEKASQGEDWRNLIPSDYPYGSDIANFPIDQVYVLAVLNHLKNAVWHVYNVNGLKSIMPAALQDEIQAFIANGQIVQRTIGEKIQAVKANGKMKELEYLLKLRWGEGEQDCIAAQFENANGKKPLLLLGTYTQYEDGVWSIERAGTTLYPDLLERVKTIFGSEYNLFYKGHPGTPSTAQRLSQFEEYGFTNLLATIPAETMMLFYDNVYVGGYGTSTFVSALPGQTLFYLGPKESFTASDGNKYGLASIAGINMGNFSTTQYIYKDNGVWFTN